MKIPVIMDGDTGHGGIMAVRRMVRECIRAGIAGIRIDDQPIEGKRKTQSAGVEVVPLDQAIARYRAAVDMKNELDPDFVVMAQCYARDAANGGLDDALQRLKAYREEAGRRLGAVRIAAFGRRDQGGARGRRGPVLVHEGTGCRAILGLDEHLALGVTIAWYPGFTPSRDLGGAVGLHDGVPTSTASPPGRISSHSRQDRPYPIPETAGGWRGPRQAARSSRSAIFRRGAGKYRG